MIESVVASYNGVSGFYTMTIMNTSKKNPIQTFKFNTLQEGLNILQEMIDGSSKTKSGNSN